MSAARSALAAVPRKGDKPKGRCSARACDKHDNGTLGRWEASWLGTGGKALKVLMPPSALVCSSGLGNGP